MSPVSLTAVAVILAGIGAVLQSTMLAMIGRRSGALAATTLAAIVGLIGITAFTLLVNRSLAGVAEAARQLPWIWVPAGLLGIGVLGGLTVAPPRVRSLGALALPLNATTP